MATVTYFPAVSSSGGSGLLDTWFSTTLLRIQSLVPTLTDVVVADDMGVPAVYWDPAVLNSGTLTVTVPSAIDMQSTTSLQGFSILTLHDHGTVTGLNKGIANMRTQKWAMAVQVTKIATIATSNNQICHLTDGVGTSVPILGILGATSTTNYSVKCGSAAAVDTTVAQSAAGTYDTLIQCSDGTNLISDINYTAPGAGSSIAISTEQASLR